MSQNPRVTLFFEEATSTCAYVVDDGNACAIIDSVLDFDSVAIRTSTKHADGIVAFVKEHNLAVAWILETHIHADHLTGMDFEGFAKPTPRSLWRLSSFFGSFYLSSVAPSTAFLGAATEFPVS